MFLKPATSDTEILKCHLKNHLQRKLEKRKKKCTRITRSWLPNLKYLQFFISKRPASFLSFFNEKKCIS